MEHDNINFDEEVARSSELAGVARDQETCYELQEIDIAPEIAREQDDEVKRESEPEGFADAQEQSDLQEIERDHDEDGEVKRGSIPATFSFTSDQEKSDDLQENERAHEDSIKQEVRRGGEPATTEVFTGDQEKSDDLQEVERVNEDNIDQDGEVRRDSEQGGFIGDQNNDDCQDIERSHDETIDQKPEESEKLKHAEQLSVNSSDAQNTFVDIPISEEKSMECHDDESSLPSGKECRELLGDASDRPNVNKSDKDTHLIEQSQSTSYSEQNAHQPVETLQSSSVLVPASGQHMSEEFLKSAIVGEKDTENSHNILSQSHSIDRDRGLHNFSSNDHIEGVEGNSGKQDQGTLIEKHVSESKSNGQSMMVNVFITWTDSETGDVLKWSHQNCNECRGRFDDWKHHVLEKHKIDEVKHESRTIVKTEMPDDFETTAIRSHLTVSIPHLLNLKPLTGRAPKRGRKPKKGVIKRRKKLPPKVIYKSDSEDEVADALDSEEAEVPDVTLPNKRKRGRPRKVVEEPDESDPLGDEDPDYEPTHQVSPKKVQVRQKKVQVRQKKLTTLRPKKEVSYRGKMYVCNRGGCNMMFGKLRECKTHEREAHGDDFKCQFEGCGMIFTTALKKNKHEVDKHDGVFECQHCELTFTSQKERIAHVKTHVNFKCEEENCGKIYAAEEYLKAHQKTHFLAKSQVCPICTKAFISKRYLNRHMKIHKDRTHQCDHCPKSFKNKEAMEKHSRRHTGIGLLVCQFCGKKLNGKVSLERHERVHTGDKPFKCKHCEKRFVCQGSLQSHEQEHTGLQWICEKCGHKFKTKGNLQEHERIHTGEKPCKCHVCGKSYAAGSSLWKHVTSRHSGFKRYKCDVCGKLFARYNGLSKHKTVHTGIRNYECKYCHKMFTTSGIRRGHYKQVHLGIKRTGHQGRAKRLKDEAKRLASGQPKQENQDEDDQKLYIDESKNEEVGSASVIEQGGSSSGGVSHGVRGKASQIIPNQEPVTGRRLPGIHSALIPFSRDRRPGMLPPHPIPPDPRSDFYTMVDSLIQFSKEH